MFFNTLPFVSCNLDFETLHVATIVLYLSCVLYIQISMPFEPLKVLGVENETTKIDKVSLFINISSLSSVC